MFRQLAASLGAGVALANPTAVDVQAPPAAIHSTAKVVFADGAGSRRLALWTATNARGELCLGYAVGSASRPARFGCLRRGLERPLLTVEAGGGLGSQATWGIVVGLASPLVKSVSADTLYGSRTTRALPLRSVGSLHGWRVFTTGVLEHPSSTTLTAYDAGGAPLVDTSGAVIHPAAAPPGGVVTVPAPGQPPSGPAWSDSAATFGETPGAESAISILLADPTLGPLVSAHRSWIEGVSTWFACNQRIVGAVLTVRFAVPLEFTADVPAVVKPSGASAYALAVNKVAVNGARELRVWVDTGLARAVGVDAERWPSTPGPGPVELLQQVSPPHDQGGPDTPGCWDSSG